MNAGEVHTAAALAYDNTWQHKGLYAVPLSGNARYTGARFTIWGNGVKLTGTKVESGTTRPKFIRRHVSRDFRLRLEE
jgi:hypothetical protein